MGLAGDIPTMALDDLTRSKVGRAREAVDEATRRAARGDNTPVPIPERPGHYLQMETAPANRILEGSTYYHTTPDGSFVRIPEDGYTVGLGSEGAKRSQFFAHSAAERFTESAARGGVSVEPTIVMVRDPDMAARLSDLAKDPTRRDEFKAVMENMEKGVGLDTAGKAYKSRHAPTVFEGEMVAAYGTQFPAPSQTLRSFDLIGHGGTPINVQVIGKPLTFAEQAKLKLEGLRTAITPRRGYKIIKGDALPEGGVMDDLRDVYRAGDEGRAPNDPHSPGRGPDPNDRTAGGTRRRGPAPERPA